MTTTQDDLKVAFAGESQANRKYLAYAKKAEKQGFPTVARLFRAAAEAETIHAMAHLRNMGGVKGTVENLEDALAGETYEHTEMYPPMVARAEAEKHKAKTGLKWAMEAEKVHAELFRQALEAVKAGADLEGAEIYLCPLCGHLEIGRPTEKCPICGVAPEKYVVVAD